MMIRNIISVFQIKTISFRFPKIDTVKLLSFNFKNKFCMFFDYFFFLFVSKMDALWSIRCRNSLTIANKWRGGTSFVHWFSQHRICVHPSGPIRSDPPVTVLFHILVIHYVPCIFDVHGRLYRLNNRCVANSAKSRTTVLQKAYSNKTSTCVNAFACRLSFCLLWC